MFGSSSPVVIEVFSVGVNEVCVRERMVSHHGNCIN